MQHLRYFLSYRFYPVDLKQFFACFLSIFGISGPIFLTEAHLLHLQHFGSEIHHSPLVLIAGKLLIDTSLLSCILRLNLCILSFWYSWHTLDFVIFIVFLIWLLPIKTQNFADCIFPIEVNTPSKWYLSLPYLKAHWDGSIHSHIQDFFKTRNQISSFQAILLLYCFIFLLQNHSIWFTSFWLYYSSLIFAPAKRLIFVSIFRIDPFNQLVY